MKLCDDLVSDETSEWFFEKKASEYEKAVVIRSLEILLRWAPENDNLNTTQTPECSKGKYNVKIRKQKSLLRSHQQPT
jgi:hypothetical protein